MSQVSCWNDANSLVQSMHARFPQNFAKTKPKQRGMTVEHVRYFPVKCANPWGPSPPASIPRPSSGLELRLATSMAIGEPRHGLEWCGMVFQWDFLGFEGYQHLEKPWKIAWFKGQSMENSHLFHGNHQLRWIPGSTQRNTPGKGFQHFHPMPIFRMSPKVWHKKWQHTTLHWALNLNP